ncbi:MAG: hypothetical protein K9G62_05870 [Alphaproteobacteria bacterium]|nr:hypothetical protein [Alphaproteobacteria bacterium]
MRNHANEIKAALAQMDEYAGKSDEELIDIFQKQIDEHDKKYPNESTIISILFASIHGTSNPVTPDQLRYKSEVNFAYRIASSYDPDEDPSPKEQRKLAAERKILQDVFTRYGLK